MDVVGAALALTSLRSPSSEIHVTLAMSRRSSPPAIGRDVLFSATLAP